MLSVLLSLLFPALLSHLCHDFQQRQHNRHTYRQEEGDVDGKLLVVGEVEEVKERRVEKRRLRRQDGLFAVLQCKVEVPGLQLCHGQLHRRHCTGHLQGSNNSRNVGTESRSTTSFGR